MVDQALEFIKINDQNLSELSKFIKTAGSSLKTFRYFERRDFSVVNNHLVTVLLSVNKKYVAYGHIDTGENKFWLGIMVQEVEIGKGWGKLMMDYLIKFCDQNNIKSLQLSVDKVNHSAIRLYKKFNFIKYSDISEKSILMIRKK